MENTKPESPRKLFVPAIIISFFAVIISVPMLSMLTVDITQTFFGNASTIALGQVAQVSTINRAAEVLFAIVMGALTLKFKNKTLLLLGVSFLLISSVGSFLSPNLLWLQIFYILEGGGSVIVAIIGFTLIGELLPTKDKPKAVSYVNAVAFGAIIIAAPAIGIITNIGGWRLNYLWLVLPIAIAALALAYIGIPAKQIAQSNLKQPFYEGYKKVLKNKSAVACLIAGMCGTAGNLAVFSIAFYRQQFLSNLPTPDQINFSTGILMATAILFIVANIFMGHLINRISPITLTIIGIIGNGLFTAIFFIMPNLSAAIIIHMLQIWFFAMAVTPWSVLALDQVPVFRGTMMSLRSIVLSIGAAISTATGGLALTFLGSYQVLGISLGAIILVGVPFIYFFTIDPNRKINKYLPP